VPVQYQLTSLRPQTQSIRSIIVIGNGGGTFWAGFREYADARPGSFQKHAHPLDDYTAQVIEKSLTPLLQRSGATYRYVYPFRFSTQPVSFMHLAQASGLAGPSILGIVIHPTYGPWIALRAAVLIDQEFDQPLSSPLSVQGFDPCPSCTERSCMKACPANVVSLEKGWDIPGCVQHRLTVTSDCIDYCHARYQCVYGREHHYPLDELQYHQAQSLATMREYQEKSD
jgi:epoxyqueuosine reductase QueG